MGQLEEARLLLEEALQGRKETLGDNHQHTRGTRSACWTRYTEAGKLIEANLIVACATGEEEGRLIY